MTVFWLALLTALFWGIAPALEKFGLAKLTPLTALTIRTMAIAFVLGIFVVASGAGKEILTADRRALLFIAAGGLISGLLAQFVYYHALKAGDISKIVPIVATYPLIAALIGIALLQEQITPGKILGAVLIVLGVIAIRLDTILWPR